MDGSCKMKVQPFSQKGFSPGWTLSVSFSVLYDVAMQKTPTALSLRKSPTSLVFHL